MIPVEVRAAAVTLGYWCLEEAKRMRGSLDPTSFKVVLFYELVVSVCEYFNKVLTC